MDDEAIKVLASLAATALIKAMTCGPWRQLRKRISTILGRGEECREQSVCDQLENSRAKIESTPVMIRKETEKETTMEWRNIFSVILTAHPELAHELRAAITDIQVDQPEAMRVAQTATAMGGSVVYQAGHDITGDHAPRESQR